MYGRNMVVKKELIRNDGHKIAQVDHGIRLPLLRICLMHILPWMFVRISESLLEKVMRKQRCPKRMQFRVNYNLWQIDPDFDYGDYR